MNTSEMAIYIKMCGKATKIQGNWYPKVGDLVLPTGFCSPQIIGVDSQSHFIFANGGKQVDLNSAIWLPDQDQLQGMVEVTPEGIITYLCYFSNTVILPVSLDDADLQARHDYWMDFKSWEQLWLAFVMDQKYHKTWNGEDWIPK